MTFLPFQWYTHSWVVCACKVLAMERFKHIHSNTKHWTYLGNKRVELETGLCSYKLLTDRYWHLECPRQPEPESFLAASIHLKLSGGELSAGSWKWTLIYMLTKFSVAPQVPQCSVYFQRCCEPGHKSLNGAYCKLCLSSRLELWALDFNIFSPTRWKNVPCCSTF